MWGHSGFQNQLTFFKSFNVNQASVLEVSGFDRGLDLRSFFVKFSFSFCACVGFL